LASPGQSQRGGGAGDGPGYGGLRPAAVPERWNREAGLGGEAAPPGSERGLKSPAPGPSVDGPGRGVHRGG